MLARVADLVRGQPAALLGIAEVDQRGRTAVGRLQRAEGGRPEAVDHGVAGRVVLPGHNGLTVMIVVDRAQDYDVGLIAGKDVLNVAGVGIGPVIVSLPGLAGVPTCGLQEGDEVVTSAQFLLDSESSLREAIQKMIASRRSSTTPNDHAGHQH